MAGCTDVVPRDEPPANDSQPPGDDVEEDCESHTFQDREDEDGWAVARVECEANVAGTVEQAWPCRSPDGAEATASTDLSGGSVRVVVEDADGKMVVDERLGDTGGDARNLTVEAGGAAGEWTLVVERLEGFEGSLTAEGYCPGSS